METHEKSVTFVQSQQQRHQSGVFDVFPMLTLTIHLFSGFFRDLLNISFFQQNSYYQAVVITITLHTGRYINHFPKNSIIDVLAAFINMSLRDFLCVTNITKFHEKLFNVTLFSVATFKLRLRTNEL